MTADVDEAGITKLSELQSGCYGRRNDGARTL
jgi:hypothetical protein